MRKSRFSESSKVFGLSSTLSESHNDERGGKGKWEGEGAREEKTEKAKWKKELTEKKRNLRFRGRQ